jgi:protein involved in polysaccharide export with SLBB domain
VVGEVESPREVELRDSDDLATLVRLAGGLRESADSASIKILGRSGTDGKVVAGDVIHVPRLAMTPNELRIQVFGEVTNPGRIPYEKGITLAQVFQQVGGPTERSNMERVTVFRRLERDQWGRQDDTRFPILAPAPGSELFKTFVLNAADSIMVPLKVGYVRVSGLVRNPGLQPYVAGKDALYYIGAAGGYLPSANKSEILLFDRVSKLTQTAGPAVMAADGDEIIVKQMERLQ